MALSCLIRTNWLRAHYLKQLNTGGGYTYVQKVQTVSCDTSVSMSPLNPLKPIGYFMYRQVSFIHSVFCLTTVPKPPPKRCLYTVRSRASSLKWEYPLLFLRSSNSFLRLLPRLLATSISTVIFPSITCFRRQFLPGLTFTNSTFCPHRVFMCFPCVSEQRAIISLYINVWLL